MIKEPLLKRLSSLCVELNNGAQLTREGAKLLVQGNWVTAKSWVTIGVELNKVYPGTIPQEDMVLICAALELSTEIRYYGTSRGSMVMGGDAVRKARAVAKKLVGGDDQLATLLDQYRNWQGIKTSWLTGKSPYDEQERLIQNKVCRDVALSNKSSDLRVLLNYAQNQLGYADKAAARELVQDYMSDTEWFRKFAEEMS